MTEDEMYEVEKNRFQSLFDDYNDFHSEDWNDVVEDNQVDGWDEEEDDVWCNEYDDSMDGDFDSAMRDAGFGTDEDYGYYGEDY